jgi:hemerythrin superfamily protein
MTLSAAIIVGCRQRRMRGTVEQEVHKAHSLIPTFESFNTITRSPLMSILEKAKTYVGVYADEDIRSKLKSDHEAIRDLTKGACEESTTAKRTESFKMLKQFLTAHARAEEAVVYTALVKKRSRSKDSRDFGNEGFVEHGIVDNLMAQIAATRPAGSDLWNARAKVLHELLDHHIDEEEKNVFEELGEHFSDEQREQMASAFETRKSQLLSGKRGRARGAEAADDASPARKAGRASASGSRRSSGESQRH